MRWIRLLGEHGLAVTQQPMNRDTPFSNALLEARPAARAATVT
jgi:hypothetical protein